MVERVCPACGASNEVTASFCTTCAEELEQHLVQRSKYALTQRLPQIPARWQPAAKAVALGVTALALEVGTALLRKEQAPPTTTALARRDDPALKLRAVRRRVWRTYRQGNLEYESVEETQWFGE